MFATVHNVSPNLLILRHAGEVLPLPGRSAKHPSGGLLEFQTREEFEPWVKDLGFFARTRKVRVMQDDGTWAEGEQARSYMHALVPKKPKKASKE
jgi:hypothetical protein